MDEEQVKSEPAKAEEPLPQLPPPAERPAPEADEKRGKKKKKTAEAAVRLTKVTRRFGSKTAVDEVSLKIAMGSVYGLIGPNGA